MSHVSKRAKANAKLVDPAKMYTVKDATAVMVKAAKPKFDETVELSIRLGVNPKKADQQVRGTMVLPHGTGKTVRILVITKGELINEALKAGADFAGFEDMITKVQGGWLEFDTVVATPDVMREVGKLGKVLGTKGLMPNPKAGTVTTNIAKAIQEIKAGRVEYRVNNEGLVNFGAGKISFGEEKIADNILFAVETILKAKPAGAKGHYMKSVAVSSTMGPGMKLDLLQFSAK
ncbi:MAG: 50S ribosomal protein L1 [Candidatus Firestonebacteria bacterium]|nr:50S ribosomal protein L1 [Candidatus Firestonebacteria bacterium]